MKSKIILLATLAFFSACSNNKLPEEPKDGEKYVDKSGNSWLWNAMLMRWMVMGAGGTSHFFYPATARWTNSTGVTTPAPSNINPSIYTPSRKANSAKSSPAKSGTTKQSVFGSSGKSHSIGG